MTVTANGLTSAISAPADEYTVYTAPVVTGVTVGGNPGSGPFTGGTTVTISGIGLWDPTVVYFGTAQATIQSYTGNQVVVVSPQVGATGPTHVTVTTSQGTSATSSADLFTYYGTAPSIIAFWNSALTDDNTAPANFNQGWDVDIYGANLSGATAVAFGATPATILSNSGTLLLTYLPLTLPPGTVNVTVTTPGGTSAITPVDQYTFVAGPYIVQTGGDGPISGGTLVTIRGMNLADATAVNFGGTAVTSFTFTSYDRNDNIYGADYGQ